MTDFDDAYLGKCWIPSGQIIDIYSEKRISEILEEQGLDADTIPDWICRHELFQTEDVGLLQDD